jgi:hypothetical protein
MDDTKLAAHLISHAKIKATSSILDAVREFHTATGLHILSVEMVYNVESKYHGEADLRADYRLEKLAVNIGGF